MRNHDYRKAESIEMRKDILAMPPEWFRVLGPLGATVNGRTAELGTQQERRLLVPLLSATGKRVTRDELESWVWDDPTERRENALSEVIATLRKTLRRQGISYEVIARDGLVWLAAPEEATDLHWFRSLVKKSSKCPDREQHGLLETALGLVQGEPLVNVKGLYRIDGYRDSIKREIREARIRLFQVAVRAGRHADHLSDIETEFRSTPQDGRLAALSMIAHHRMGMTQKASETYMDHQKSLDGILADAELRELQERILRNEPDIGRDPLLGVPYDGEPEDEPEESSEKPRDQLPTVAHKFYGGQKFHNTAFGNGPNIFLTSREDDGQDGHE
jgi:DNA-binding SARP family transcriptional activator